MAELRTADNWKGFVHKPLLCFYSSYYKAALLGGFKEATSPHFDLELDKWNAEEFVRWLYSGQLGDTLSGPMVRDLIRLYSFADKVDIPALRRQILTELVAKQKPMMKLGEYHLSYESIAIIIDTLPPSSPLYRYAVDWCVNHWSHVQAERSQQNQAYEVLSKEFLHLVLYRHLMRAQTTNRDTQASCACCHRPCEYHEHDTREEWHESKFQHIPFDGASY
jgi:hypothetical protein